MLADMVTQTEAARALVYAVARFIDSDPKDVSMASAMSKLFASDVAMKVTVDAVQIMGGYGYMREYPAEKMMRDAKILQIYEGTNQIQRIIKRPDKSGVKKNKPYFSPEKEKVKKSRFILTYDFLCYFFSKSNKDHYNIAVLCQTGA
jgi:hypothetical protein